MNNNSKIIKYRKINVNVTLSIRVTSLAWNFSQLVFGSERSAFDSVHGGSCSSLFTEADSNSVAPRCESGCRMRLTCRLLFSGCVLWSVSITAAIEPISTSIAVGMAAALTGFLARYQNVFYYFQECCRPEWISCNTTGLQELLCPYVNAFTVTVLHKSTFPLKY